MSDNPKKLIPCFLCGNAAEVKQSKKQKPYFVCEPCGVQVFVRRETGIALLNKLLQSPANNTVSTHGTIGRTYDVLALINRLAQLKAKQSEIRDKQGFMESLTGDGSFASAEKVLQREIEQIETQLKSMAK